MSGPNVESSKDRKAETPPAAAAKGSLREALGIPAGCVLIKRARGPQQAQNGLIGMVHLGGVYTVDVATAVTLTEKGGEFDPLPEFVDEVEAAK